MRRNLKTRQTSCNRTELNFSSILFLAASAQDDAGSIVRQFIEGLGAVGNAVTRGIRYLLSQAGLNIPEPAITVASIILIILVLYKFGGAVNKIVLLALIFLLLSYMAGLLSGFL